MADSWKEAERALRQELDMAEGRVQEVRAQLRESGQRIKDYETTIGKYRARTAELQVSDRLLGIRQHPSGRPTSKTSRTRSSPWSTDRPSRRLSARRTRRRR